MQGDVTALPFQDEAFDLVVCSEVLEHVPNWGRAVSEIYRILKRRGEVVITTPNRFSLYGLSFSVGRRLVGSRHPFDNWKSHRQIGRVLKEVGFKHIEARGACFLPGPICYFQPLRSFTLLTLPLFAYVERLAAKRYPFYLISYLAVVRATK
jgi:SAM-dependent methyltransferase